MRGYSVLFFIILMLAWGCRSSDKYDIVIANVGLFDGEQDLGVVSIGINADTIALISKKPLLGDSVMDGSGKYVMPGLVNAHVHITSLENLKEGYEYGILANLNMHTGLEDRENTFRQYRDSLGYPMYFGSGYAATVPMGHPTQFSPGMETIDDSVSVEQWVDNRIANNADYIKIVREGHPWFNYPAAPTLDYKTIGEIISYAHRKGYKAVVHIGTSKEMLEVARYKPDGFVHMWSFKKDSYLSDEDWMTIKGSGAFVIPTALLTAKENLQHVEDPDDEMTKWALENFITREETIEGIKRIHNEGITIVAGTDAPNAGLNYGSDLLEELLVYSRADMSNVEVLKTVTGNAAKAFDLPVGILHVGSKTNMILLNGNPVQDLSALRDIQAIWKTEKHNTKLQ